MNKGRKLVIIWLCLTAIFGVQACQVEPETETEIPQEVVNEVGQRLAAWADGHCTTIWINEKPINIEDGNAGGCSQVWWQHPEGLAFLERGDQMPPEIRPGAEAWQRQNDLVFDHLRALIQASTCNLADLQQKVSEFSQETTREEVQEALSCLGEIQFAAVAWGIE